MCGLAARLARRPGERHPQRRYARENVPCTRPPSPWRASTARRCLLGEASKVTNRPDADYRNIPSAGPFAHYRGTGDILRIQTARPDDALRQELLLCVGFENVAQFGFSGILPLSFLRQCSDKAISLGTLEAGDISLTQPVEVGSDTRLAAPHHACAPIPDWRARRFGSRPSSRDDGGSALSGNLTPRPWPRPEPRPAPAGPRCCHSPAPGCRACS